MTIQKSYRKVPINQEEKAAVFWRTQPVEARLAALEQIRIEYHQWKYGTEPRLQRVYTILKQ